MNFELKIKQPEELGYERPCQDFFERLAKEEPWQLFYWIYDNTLSIGMRAIAIEAYGKIPYKESFVDIDQPIPAGYQEELDFFLKEKEGLKTLLQFNQAMLFEAAIYAAKEQRGNKCKVAYKNSILKLKKCCEILIECCDEFLEED